MRVHRVDPSVVDCFNVSGFSYCVRIDQEIKIVVKWGSFHRIFSSVYLLIFFVNNSFQYECGRKIL